MSRERYISLTRNEWDRLKRQAETKECAEIPQENLNQKLIEQSQEWVKTWPNSAQAQVANYEAKKVEKRLQNIETVKAQQQKEKAKQRVNIEALQKAKQMIFNDSCYGRELLSALRYSKDREEREKQIEFKKYIKEEAAKHEKALDDKIAAMTDNIYNLENRDRERKAKVRQIDDERRAHNKMMYEIRKTQIQEEYNKEKLGADEDAKLMKQLLDFEAQETDHCKELIASEMVQFKIYNRKVREDSRKRDELDTAIIDIWRRYNDRVKSKTKAVMEKIHQERHDTPLMRKAYETARIALEKKEKMYNDFIDKGIKKYEEKCLQKEEKEKIDEFNRKTKSLEMAQDNKNRVKESDMLEYWRKCACERYSLLPQEKPRKICKEDGEKDKDKYPTFLKKCTTLRDALKKRTQEPTPWTALEPSHKHFAEQAEAILAECKYKDMVQKVIANYRKNNGLDEKTLPITNYNTNDTYCCTCTK